MIMKRKILAVLLLVILTICDCQEQPVYHIRPDNCQQEKCCSYPPPDCMTLSEYALNVSLNSRLELDGGDYYLSSVLFVNGTGFQRFSIIGSGLEDTTILCTHNATLNFNCLSSIIVENVSFVSCGVSLTNMDTVNLVDASFSNSTSGTLDIQNCSSVQLTNLKIANNLNSQNTIVNVKDSDNLTLTNLAVENNSIGTIDSSCVYSNFPKANTVIMRIDGSHIDADNILVTDNIGPFGVLLMTNAVVTVNGDWRLEQNQVCINGSLAFNQTMVNFNGNLIFIENKGMNQKNESTAGLLLYDSTSLILKGTIESTRNQAYITSIQLIASQLYINGCLNMSNNFNSFQAASFLDRSKLSIDGSLITHNNSFRQREILCDTSDISILGSVSFINNTQTPFALYSSSMIMSGQNKFENNAGVLFTGRSDVQIYGNSSFVNNSVQDIYNNGALAVVQTNLVLGGTYIIKDNYFSDKNGAGIYASATSTIKFSGTGYFINNRGNDGGGIFMDQQSRIELDKGTRLHFLNNSAVRGAAIFITTTAQYTRCSSNSNECLVGFEDKDNVSLVFQHNKASPGASVMHVNFDRIENNDNNFQALNDLNNTIDEGSFIGNSPPHYASDSYWLCFCDIDSPEICS